MKLFLKIFCAVIVIFLFGSSLSHSQDKKETLFQTSTIQALLEGVYDGDVSFKNLRKQGDHGIGTFNALDGEMICLDNKFFQIRSDGKVYPVKNRMKTPFAVMTFFDEDITISSREQLTYTDLQRYIDLNIPSENIFYAIRIDGTFNYVKTRSVPAQKRPYPPLVEIAKKQPVFEFHNVKGTLIGFYLPEYMKGINVPGYHLHFITEDRTGGGHLLEIESSNITVKLDTTGNMSLSLPDTEDFLDVDLTGNKTYELKAVEN